MTRYVATERQLIILGRRELCKQEGHDPVRSELATLRGERVYKCDRCDAKFEITYPELLNVEVRSDE